MATSLVRFEKNLNLPEHIEKHRCEDGKFRFIYFTTYIPTRKTYCGKHETSKYYDGYFGSGKYLNAAFKKYGQENFVRKVVEWCNTSDELIKAETKWLEIIKPPDNPWFYNLSKCSAGGYTFYKNRVHNLSEEGRLRISKANKGRSRPDVVERLSKSNNNFSDYWIGKTRSLKDRENKSIAAQKNVLNGTHFSVIMVTCPHCNIITNTGNAKR